MPRHTVQIRTGEYRVRFAAHCGLGAYTVGPERTTEQDARRVLGRLCRRRAKSGHPIYTIKIGREYEIGEPEGAGLVPDTAGLAWIDPVTVPGVPCYQCGEPVIIGEPCGSCQPEPEPDL